MRGKARQFNWLSLEAFFGCLLIGTGLSCRNTASWSSCVLPAAFGAYRHADNTLVFELPASGGYLANGVPLAAEQLEPQLRAVFAPRSESTRAVFVRPVAAGRCPDLEVLAAAARAAGGRAFDAHASGWPDSFKTVLLPESLP